MKKIIENIIESKKNNYTKYSDIFEKYKTSQNPHSLFICCSDSRLQTSLITGAKPGELFTIRNIANVIPPYNRKNKFPATASSIEYAVLLLKVKNIIICGHSNCGGCKSLLKDSKEFKKTPNIKKWLKMLNPTKKFIKNNNFEKTESEIEKHNILTQINNLMTYPFIKKLHNNNEINIIGLYYTLENGNTYILNNDTNSFDLLN